MKGDRWLLLGTCVVAIAFAGLASSKPGDERESVANLLPELRLVTHDIGRPGYEEIWLYTGPGDADVLTRRLNAALAHRRGWWAPDVKTGSPFPYHNMFDAVIQPSFFKRILWKLRPPLSSRSILDLRIIRGRAGAKPDGGPWTTLVVRDTNRRPLKPDMSEPLQGWGVQP